MDVAERVGQTMKLLRKQKGITQVDVAAQLGVTQGYVSLVENGFRGKGALLFLEQVADILGVELSDLFEVAKELEGPCST